MTENTKAASPQLWSLYTKKFPVIFLFIIVQNVKCSKKDTFGSDGLSDYASDFYFVDNLFKIFVGSENLA